MATTSATARPLRIGRAPLRALMDGLLPVQQLPHHGAHLAQILGKVVHPATDLSARIAQLNLQPPHLRANTRPHCRQSVPSRRRPPHRQCRRWLQLRLRLQLWGLERQRRRKDHMEPVPCRRVGRRVVVEPQPVGYGRHGKLGATWGRIRRIHHRPGAAAASRGASRACHEAPTPCISPRSPSPSNYTVRDRRGGHAHHRP
jgi:hypothetical protein